MQKIKLTKMQGLGNDFVILDYSEYEKTNLSMPQLAKKICDRNFGVGADGMIITDINAKGADIGWYFYNSDGSSAQMCGNGIRCFAKYVFDNNLVSSKKFSVKTEAGIITPEILEDGNVRVNMSKPILEPSKIPFNMAEGFNQTLEVGGRQFIVNAVSMGNPHCIIFVDGKEDLLDLAKNFGPLLENHVSFPEKTNVEFVEILSRNEINLRVYERGCGITLACGTGACATVVAGILNNLTDSIVKVNLLGGALTIEWQGSCENADFDVFMSGPAEYSFFAEYIL